MKVEVWCQGSRPPHRGEGEITKLGSFECDLVPREGDYISIDPLGTNVFVRSVQLDLYNNSVAVYVDGPPTYLLTADEKIGFQPGSSEGEETG